MADKAASAADAFAAEPIDERDVELLRKVAATYREVDPVPEGLIERLRFGITLDALHAEIASLERMDGLIGARGGEAGDVHSVTFTSTSLTTMVTITPAGAERVRIDGWAAPGDGVSVELRIVGARLHATADADGRFVFDDVPRGLAQFVLRLPGSVADPPVITPSIEF
jgi:hypothetical protein